MKVRSGKNQFLSTVSDNCHVAETTCGALVPSGAKWCKRCCCGMRCQMRVRIIQNFIYDKRWLRQLATAAPAAAATDLRMCNNTISLATNESVNLRVNTRLTRWHLAIVETFPFAFECDSCRQLDGSGSSRSSSYSNSDSKFKLLLAPFLLHLLLLLLLLWPGSRCCRRMRAHARAQRINLSYCI